MLLSSERRIQVRIEMTCGVDEAMAGQDRRSEGLCW